MNPDNKTETQTGSVLSNIVFDELSLGQSASLSRTLSEQDIQAFALVSGDVNPAHLDAEYAQGTPFKAVIAHGMWSGALISCLLGTRFPGPGTIYLKQDLNFRRPVYIGDTVTVTLTVAQKDEAKKRVELDCLVVNQDNKTVVEGTAKIIAPTEKIERAVMPLPQWGSAAATES